VQPHNHQTKEKQLLDFDQTYPCPACRHGMLVPITLTEAWGCDRCKQIFESRAEPNTIGKLATPYHRQRTWRWNGKSWVVGSKLVRPKAINAITLTAGVIALLWIGLSQAAPPSVLVLGVLALVLLLVVMFWMLQQR